MLSQFILIGLLWFYIIRKDVFFGVYYFFLYIYALPAEIGYWYHPELSVSVKAYFGEELWFSYYSFITLSMLAFFFFFLLYRRTLALKPLGCVRTIEPDFSFIGISIVIFLLVIESIGFVFYFDDMSWYSASDELFVNENPAVLFVLMLFKTSVSINLILYCIHRQRSANRTILKLVKILLVPSLILFIVFSFKLGNRTDIVALALGVLIFEFFNQRLSLKKIGSMIMILPIIVYVLILIETFRDENRSIYDSLLTTLLMKDYFAPAHMLITAMAYQYIDPINVIISNSANSLIMLGYPYLQMPITELINPGIATRSQGYAFYIFTEGYLFMGDAGFIYNGLILVFLLGIWRNLSRTNNLDFNNFMIALTASMLVNLVRGQSSYFVKYLYTFIIPAAFLYLMLARKGWFLKKPSK